MPSRGARRTEEVGRRLAAEPELIERAADPAEDWGHEDVLLADDAEALVWRPILEWIEAR